MLQEDLYTEFKQSFNEDTIVTLAAFANAKGGTVYVGMKDDATPCGVSLGPETVQHWINEIKQKTEPVEAIRELLLNCIVHRDYQSPTDVQIKIFDNSIVFFNPSGLYGNITEEDLKTDSYKASTRNRQVAEAFYLTKDIEKYGSGFVRIRGLVAGYPTMQFFYHNENYGFSAGFSYEVQKKADSLLEETGQETVKKNPTENPTENLSDLEKKIIFVLRDNPAYTQKQIAEALSIGYTTVREYIVRLRNKGAICRIGPDKGGYWQVIETKDNSDEIE